MLDAVDPPATETAVGDAEIVKFGAAVTVRVRVAVSTVEPLVPVTVIVLEPTAAVLAAVKVSVLPAEPVTEEELKLAVTPVGRPETVRATALENPFTAVTVTLLVALVPCSTETSAAASVKLASVLVEIAG